MFTNRDVPDADLFLDVDEPDQLWKSYYTAIAVPYYTMMSYKTKSSEEKGKMGTWRAAVGYAIGVACGIGLIPITIALGDDQAAWIEFGAILGVLSAVCLYITYKFSREVYHDEGEMAEKEAKVSIIEGLKILIHNKYWIKITLVGVAMNLVYGIALIAPLHYGQRDHIGGLEVGSHFPDERNEIDERFTLLWKQIVQII